MRHYEIFTWADGFGRWFAKVDFHHGVGNTAEAEALKYRALEAAKRSIRREIQERQKATVKRLTYDVVANKLDMMNRLWSITVAERTEQEDG